MVLEAGRQAFNCNQVLHVCAFCPATANRPETRPQNVAHAVPGDTHMQSEQDTQNDDHSNAWARQQWADCYTLHPLFLPELQANASSSPPWR